MIGWRILSSAGMSITLRWTRISNLSKVAVPLPHGDFLVVTFNLFVGKGIGPLMTTPARAVISFIDCITAFIGLISMLLNLILTRVIFLIEEIGF